MKCRLTKFPLTHLLLLYLILLLQKKKKKNSSESIPNAYNFYETGLCVNVCWCVFKTQANIYGEASFQRSQKRFILDVQRKGFTIENLTECQYLSDIVKVYFKIGHWILDSRINKKDVSFTKKV